MTEPMVVASRRVAEWDRRQEPTRGRGGKEGRKAPQTQAEAGPRAGFHLQNLVLHLLQPPQHPRKRQSSLAGGRPASRGFRPTQLQVRLGSGSPGPAWAPAARRHLLQLSEHVPCHNHRGELGEKESQASFPTVAHSYTPCREPSPGGPGTKGAAGATTSQTPPANLRS